MNADHGVGREPEAAVTPGSRRIFFLADMDRAKPLPVAKTETKRQVWNGVSARPMSDYLILSILSVPATRSNALPP